MPLFSAAEYFGSAKSTKRIDPFSFLDFKKFTSFTQRGHSPSNKSLRSCDDDDDDDVDDDDDDDDDDDVDVTTELFCAERPERF